MSEWINHLHAFKWGAIMLAKKKHQQNRFGRRLLYFFLSLAIIPFCICSWIIFANDIFGSINEQLVRYPKGQLVWAGYGVYGSGDYGVKVYYHWTPDSIDIVEDYYRSVILERKPSLVRMTDFNSNDLVVCWWVGFHRTDGCETLKAFSQIKEGTLITFSHDYFAG